MQLSTLTDEELLRHLDEKAHLSPVIGELCKRLEARSHLPGEDSNRRVECPVCQAQLEADYDEGNNMFTIGIEK